ncbi:MAG: hypothetical protein LUI14_08205, partial [Lachnospiraceae bacterium]|nr:hypothetical protein [Lachnospiraceae bacterium]
NGVSKSRVLCGVEIPRVYYMKTDGELPEDEVGGRPGHLYCIKKDGTQETRLDYPQIIGE